MSFSIGSALFAYVATMLTSIIVAKRSSNWRIRLLALTVGLLPLCQSVVLLGTHGIWLTSEVAQTAQMLELLVSALCLTSVHLLNRENVDRRSTQARLRVAEGVMPGSATDRNI
jgi:hypothetical protein